MYMPVCFWCTWCE